MGPTNLSEFTVTEAEIVEGCKRGDRQAQHRLYEMTADRVYRLLLRMMGAQEDAWDLCHDTYVRVFTKIGQYDGRSGVFTWVYRVAVNEALQFLRRQKRYAQLLRQGDVAGAASSQTGAVDARIDVEQALASLPDNERALIVLRYYEGMGYAEIAAVLDRPLGTIASGLNRARELLRRALTDEAATTGRPA